MVRPLWTPQNENDLDDPRTAAAVEALTGGRVPRYVAAPVVLQALARLRLWALRHSPDGGTGHLSDSRFVSIAWPEAADAPRNLGGVRKLGPLLRDALRTPDAEGRSWLLHCDDLACARQTPDETQASAQHRCPHEALADQYARHSRYSRRVKKPPAPEQPTRTADDVRAELAEAGRRTSVAQTSPAPGPQPEQGVEKDRGVRGGAPAGDDLGRQAEEQQGRVLGVGMGRATRWVRLAAEAVRDAEPNTRMHVAAGGRNVTLGTCEHYLDRVARFDAGAADSAREGLGHGDGPGVLLFRLAPEVVERTIHGLAGKLERGEIRKLAPFVRSTLAGVWTRYLSALAERGLGDGRASGYG